MPLSHVTPNGFEIHNIGDGVDIELVWTVANIEEIKYFKIEQHNRFHRKWEPYDNFHGIVEPDLTDPSRPSQRLRLSLFENPGQHSFRIKSITHNGDESAWVIASIDIKANIKETDEHARYWVESGLEAVSIAGNHVKVGYGIAHLAGIRTTITQDTTVAIPQSVNKHYIIYINRDSIIARSESTSTPSHSIRLANVIVDANGDMTVQDTRFLWPPEDISIEYDGYPDHFDIQWENYNELNLAGYKIYRGTSSNDLSLLETIDDIEENYYKDDYSITPGQQYYYRMSSFDWGGNESYLSSIINREATDMTPPLAPNEPQTHVYGLEGEITADIWWNSIEGVANYNVYISSSPILGDPYTNTEETSITVTGLSRNVPQYYVGITAIGDNGVESSMSPVATFQFNIIKIPQVPQWSSPSYTTTGPIGGPAEATLYFDPVTHYEAEQGQDPIQIDGIGQYILRMHKSNGGVVVVRQGIDQQYNEHNEPLQNSVTIYSTGGYIQSFSLIVEDVYGNKSASSEILNVTFGSQDIPKAPGNLEVEHIPPIAQEDVDSIKFKWDEVIENTDNEVYDPGDIVEYIIYRHSHGVIYEYTRVDADDSEFYNEELGIYEFIDSNVSRSRTYMYSAVAVNLDGNVSARPDFVSVLVASTSPDSVTNVLLTPTRVDADTFKIDVSWDNTNVNEGTFNRYEIYRRSTDNWSLVGVITNYISTTHTIDNLKPGVHKYGVVVRDTYGERCTDVSGETPPNHEITISYSINPKPISNITITPISSSMFIDIVDPKENTANEDISHVISQYNIVIVSASTSNEIESFDPDNPPEGAVLSSFIFSSYQHVVGSEVKYWNFAVQVQDVYSNKSTWVLGTPTESLGETAKVTPPDNPTDIQLSSGFESSGVDRTRNFYMDCTWDGTASEEDTAFSHYNIYAEPGEYTASLWRGRSKTESFRVNNLIPNTEYTVKVTAEDKFGNESTGVSDFQETSSDDQAIEWTGYEDSDFICIRGLGRFALTWPNVKSVNRFVDYYEVEFTSSESAFDLNEHHAPLEPASGWGVAYSGDSTYFMHGGRAGELDYQRYYIYRVRTVTTSGIQSSWKYFSGHNTQPRQTDENDIVVNGIYAYHLQSNSVSTEHISTGSLITEHVHIDGIDARSGRIHNIQTANLDISAGGRNFLRNSSFAMFHTDSSEPDFLDWVESGNVTIQEIDSPVAEHALEITGGATIYQELDKDMSGKIVTLSLWVKCLDPAAINGYAALVYDNPTEESIEIDLSDLMAVNSWDRLSTEHLHYSGEEEPYPLAVKVPESSTNHKLEIHVESTLEPVYIACVYLQEGTMLTQWVPYPGEAYGASGSVQINSNGIRVDGNADIRLSNNILISSSNVNNTAGINIIGTGDKELIMTASGVTSKGGMLSVLSGVDTNDGLVIDSTGLKAYASQGIPTVQIGITGDISITGNFNIQSTNALNLMTLDNTGIRFTDDGVTKLHLDAINNKLEVRDDFLIQSGSGSNILKLSNEELRFSRVGQGHLLINDTGIQIRGEMVEISTDINNTGHRVVFDQYGLTGYSSTETIAYKLNTDGTAEFHGGSLLVKSAESGSRITLDMTQPQEANRGIYIYDSEDIEVLTMTNSGIKIDTRVTLDGDGLTITDGAFNLKSSGENITIDGSGIRAEIDANNYIEIDSTGLTSIGGAIHIKTTNVPNAARMEIESDHLSVYKENEANPSIYLGLENNEPAINVKDGSFLLESQIDEVEMQSSISINDEGIYIRDYEGEEFTENGVRISAGGVWVYNNGDYSKVIDKNGLIFGDTLIKDIVTGIAHDGETIDLPESFTNKPKMLLTPHRMPAYVESYSLNAPTSVQVTTIAPFDEEECFNLVAGSLTRSHYVIGVTAFNGELGESNLGYVVEEIPPSGEAYDPLPPVDIKVSWDPVPNATHYMLYISETNTGDIVPHSRPKNVPAYDATTGSSIGYSFSANTTEVALRSQQGNVVAPLINQSLPIPVHQRVEAINISMSDDGMGNPVLPWSFDVRAQVIQAGAIQSFPIDNIELAPTGETYQVGGAEHTIEDITNFRLFGIVTMQYSWGWFPGPLTYGTTVEIQVQKYVGSTWETQEDLGQTLVLRQTKSPPWLASAENQTIPFSFNIDVGEGEWRFILIHPDGAEYLSNGNYQWLQLPSVQPDRYRHTGDVILYEGADCEIQYMAIDGGEEG